MTVAVPVRSRRGRRLHRGGALLLAGSVALLVPVVVGTKSAGLVFGGLALLVLAVLAIARPAVALTMLVISEFAGLPFVAVENGLPGVYTPMLVLGALSVLAALRKPEYRARLRRPPLAPFALLGVLLLAYIPATVLSVRPYETALDNEVFFKECIFLLVVTMLAWLVDRPWWIAVMIVLPMSVIGLLTVVNQVALGSSASFGGFATVATASGHLVATDRHQGPLPDPNFWGQYLVLGLPFAYALLDRSIRARAWWHTGGYAAVTVMLLAGVYLTGSRGALIATLVSVLVWVVACGPRSRRGALRCLPVAVAIMLIPGVGNRLVDVGSAFEDLPAYAIDPSLVERTAAQEIAAMMFFDRPVFGRGPGTFKYEIYEYASRKPDLLIGVTGAAHNLYLEIAAEAGIVGLAGWLAAYTGICVLAGRSVLRLAGVQRANRARAPTRALAAAALASAIGWAVTSLFLHLALVRPVFLLFAMIGLLNLTTRNGVPEQTGAARRAMIRATGALRTGLAVGTLLTVASSLVAGILLVSLAIPSYTAVTRYTLTPAPRTYETYTLDIRRRVPVLPAYAAMIQGDAPRRYARIDAEPATGMITISTTGSSSDEATRRAGEVMVAAGARLHRFGADRQYRLLEVSPLEVTESRTYTPSALAVVAAVVLIQMLLLVAFLLRTHIRRWKQVLA